MANQVTETQVNEAQEQERKARAEAQESEQARQDAEDRAADAEARAGGGDDDDSDPTPAVASVGDAHAHDADPSDADGDAQESDPMLNPALEAERAERERRNQETRQREDEEREREPTAPPPDAEDVEMMNSGVALLDPNRSDPDGEIGAPPPEPPPGMSWLDVGLNEAAAATVGPTDKGDAGDTAPDTRPGGDPDGDGIPNLVDTDDDGDGIPDVQDARPFEPDAAAIVVIRRPARRLPAPGQPVAAPEPKPRSAAEELEEAMATIAPTPRRQRTERGPKDWTPKVGKGEPPPKPVLVLGR